MTGFAEHFERIHNNIELAVKGKSEVVGLLILALACGGHVLIEDVPGVGKTTLGKALARSVDVSFGRIQFTPDLLPVDITGTSVFNRTDATFEFRPGPIFSNIVLADEINRASPKAQSALLEAMGEQQVTLEGVTRPLQAPFTVIATQNPLEYEGTYPLPESQLDRFLMRLQVGYPDRAAEDSILADRGSQEPVEQIGPVADAAVVNAMSAQLEQVHVSAALRSYLLDVAAATRRHRGLSLGLSPRGVLAVLKTARARAASLGRPYVAPDDIKALAPSLLTHRLLPARGGATRTDDIVAEILDSVPVPRRND
ncbi:MAG: MoxR family ATPase [Acidimicrobiaceae bacterium]|nr:MoxR family ATPase [Acidimicrobiaceae bacterium]MCY4175769.1 MoxR family ATPase [Acidimicrobiaceae bacterium]MCY4280858.1 MoxR family ATPase [Acidimicrobiaceae bacterium]MCY4294587.1 MoxR family ATPase [Acidimicrobiaceae bacterium]